MERTRQVHLLTICVCEILAFTIVSAGPFAWRKKDNFDIVVDQMTRVTTENCLSKPRSELEMPAETVSHVPVYNKLLNNVYFSNRSMLLYMHNLALNRAFFYSFIYQKINTSNEFRNQPGLMYLYMSAAADVSASPGWINGSSLLYDNKCMYPSWYTNVDINITLPLFGTSAWRADDYNKPTNWSRELTNRTIEVVDYAIGRAINYTDESNNYAPYTRYGYDPTDTRQEKPMFWWPDNTGYKDSLRKYTYSVSISTGAFTSEEFKDIKFYGPPQPDQRDIDITLPVLFTKPYFDCGRSNRWITTMSSPVVDYMPRYSPYIHLRRPRFVAVIGIDGEFERIDINQCPVSLGNDGPNYFSNTHKCRPTTMCEPISGYGFRRGGYQCVCLPGYEYPWWHDGPFQGWEIEQATEDEYNSEFDCLKIDVMQVIPTWMPEYVQRGKRSTLHIASKKYEFMMLASPIQDMSASPRLKKLVSKRKLRSADGTEENVTGIFKAKFVKRYADETRKVRMNREAFKFENWKRMTDIYNKYINIQMYNCKSHIADDLYLPEDAGYGVNTQFEAQGRLALRLSHFLSNFVQNVDEYEQFGFLRGDLRLNVTHIFGEVLATVMGDFKVLGAGVFFDQYKFREPPQVSLYDPNNYDNGITREFFGPYAWRIQNHGYGLDIFRAIDSAGNQNQYVDQPWFNRTKHRWSTNYSGLKKYVVKPMIRSGQWSASSVRFEHYPITYMAPSYEDGEWLRPEFRCDNKVMDWVSTYMVPFFGMNSIKSSVEFKGVVTIDVKLKYLDLIQCPSDFYVPNAFKNTAKCDFKSQYCVPLPGRGFEPGAYKCECRQGYTYPFQDQSWFFHGQTMEEEYNKKMAGKPNRYDTLKCRISGAAPTAVNWALLVSILVAFML